MAWQTPKTNWNSDYDSSGNYIGDHPSAQDYQRIKGNLLEIATLAADLYGQIPMPAIPDITDESFYFDSTINALERAIDAIRDNAFDPGIIATKTWYGGDSAPAADDYNRIESSCLKFYNSILAQKAVLKKLAFTLGGVQF